MYLTLTPSPVPTFPLSPQSTLFNFSSFSPKPLHPHHHLLCPRPRVHKIPIISSHKSQCKPSGSKNHSTRCFDQTLAPIHNDNGETNSVFKWVAKPIACTLFCIAVGFFPLGHGKFLPLPAVAAVAQEKEVVLKRKEHEYSGYTRALLQTVSSLIRGVEEVRRGSGDLKAVEAALEEVRSKKTKLQDQIMSGLYAELRELKGEREDLVKKSEELVEWVMKVKKSGGAKSGEEAKPGGEMGSVEEKYNELLQKIDEIENRIERREFVALSIGVRELSFIERECEVLVEKFRREMRLKSKDR